MQFFSCYYFTYFEENQIICCLCLFVIDMMFFNIRCQVVHCSLMWWFFIVLMRLTQSTARQWHVVMVKWCQHSDCQNEVFSISRTFSLTTHENFISTTLLRCQTCNCVLKTHKSFRYKLTVLILQNVSCGFLGLINVGHICLWFIAEQFL